MPITKFIRIMEWNANGLIQHKNELQAILDKENIDICLICETHFTKQSFIRFKNYSVYHTIHPSNNARGGSAIIVKSNIDHYEEEKTSMEEFQATTITCKVNNTNMSFTSVYCPPRHELKCDKYKLLINKHKFKFIMGGDFNSKNIHWGSRLTNTKGIELLKAVVETGCESISTGSPTYWPSDPNKIPDLIDFFITRKISKLNLEIKNGYDLNSDHSPIYLTFFCDVQKKNFNTTLSNKHTDWRLYKSIIRDNIDTTSHINNADDLEREVENFTALLQQSAWSSTPILKKQERQTSYPQAIRNLIANKRKLRKKWHQTRFPQDKTILNNATQILRREIAKFKNANLNNYLAELTYDNKTDYSLWKATNQLKRPINQTSAIKTSDGSWAKSSFEKSFVFAEYLSTVFSSGLNNDQELEAINNNEEEDIPPFSITEVKKEISRLKSKKSPGYDQIVAVLLKKLPHQGVVKISNIFNAALNLKHMPNLWKVAEIIMIPKPGKNPREASSYRPISLLPVIGKLFEKLFSKRLKKVIFERNIIPNHQFGFREKHSTIEQIHRITHSIEIALEKKEICSAVFLDVSKAFDDVWHKGLLHKINLLLPRQYCQMLESYLLDRYFRVKQDDDYSNLYHINSGVPQGSILGPILYLLYTYDIPVSENCIVGTFADDTVIMSIGQDITTSTSKLQSALLELEQWTKKWRIKLNSLKSTHVNFTNKNVDYKPIYIDEQIVPFANTAKYLGMTLDAKLHWKEHVKKKKEELDIKYRNYRWLIGRKSSLSLHNKIMIYKQILKPVWTYGIQIWGCAKNSVIEIIQRFQNKVLRNIVKAPWYVRNSDIHRDLNINTIASEIQNRAEAHEIKLLHHVNSEIPALLNTSGMPRRLNRYKPHDLKWRFNQ